MSAGFGDTWNSVLDTVSDTFFSTVDRAGQVVQQLPSVIEKGRTTIQNVSAAASGRPLEPQPVFTTSALETQAGRDLNRGTVGTAGTLSGTLQTGLGGLGKPETLLLVGAAVLAAFAVARL